VSQSRRCRSPRSAVPGSGDAAGQATCHIGPHQASRTANSPAAARNRTGSSNNASNPSTTFRVTPVAPTVGSCTTAVRTGVNADTIDHHPRE
jgi:hypothetical protein